METVLLPAVPYGKATVTALGFFDGVHIAHAALLEKTAAVAKERGLVPAVFTFLDAPHKTGERLLSFEERCARFEAYGIETVFAAPFEALRALSPTDFVEQILKKTCRSALAVCGFNFRFGRGAEGDSTLLTSLLPDSVVLAPIELDGGAVSASRVRELLCLGLVEEAARLLGAPYAVRGEVLHGKALGRTIGFPTANMLPEGLLPRDGVYETRVLFEGKSYAGLTDIGLRPTAETAGERRMETYIPHFSGDLYGKTLTVSFLRRLRGETQFESIEELKAQLALDLAEIDKTERKRTNGTNE